MKPCFRVFYCQQRTGFSIASHQPKPMPLARIVDLAENVLESTGDFLGLVDDDHGLLQFMYLARGKDDVRPIRAELTDEAGHGTCVRQLSPIELPSILRRLPERLSKDPIPGLHF